MKYCPYCGVVLADGAASFCADCGKALPERSPQTERQKEASPQTHPEPVKKAPKLRKERKKPFKRSQTEKRRSIPADLPTDDDGYDGYYNDVPTEDDGHVREGLEPGLIKRIVLLGAGVAVVIALAILAMYFL